ncbi:MAG: SAM-dependent methyltransferase [Nanoarchaeota archaeon]|jgi:cyclopropane fatty-acyl-phospholipid synthase-like methyltransferase|nr:SAM-dependent methyltransferase [Nanoarchaeota archaeon]|tara:strand:+ start:9838 stop:10437 length:600 start_codon:yes stop_codon:yes gene_type:complete
MNEVTIAAFNQFAEQYADFTFPNILQYELNRFISLIPKKAKILDLACGSGRDVHYFMDYGYEVIGIDASENIIKEAKERVPEGDFKVMHLESLDFPKEFFDAIWALDAISFLKKTGLPKVLATLHTLLKPKGIIFISVRQGEEEKEIEYEKLGKSKIKISFFTQKELERSLVNAGFEIHNSFIQKGEDFTWINAYAKKK